ncbi:DUF1638 domain-containing protein [Oscillospiraceae bacterium CM]|nr:DUF1638 domain-containing protein [Oscillospiraceae bacterium CM]
MGKTMIIACRSFHHELEAAFDTLGFSQPIIWLESGLHNFPDKLRLELQKTLDGLHDVDRVLLIFGFCGNAVVGLKTGSFELVLPRADDCIAVFLGSSEAKRKLERTYFLTKGSLEGERNIWAEYQYAVNKYGIASGKRIFSAMLGNYKYLGILDTGGYDVASIHAITDEIAAALELEKKVISASFSYITALLTGPWDSSRFVTVAPQTEITLASLHA